MLWSHKCFYSTGSTSKRSFWWTHVTTEDDEDEACKLRLYDDFNTCNDKFVSNFSSRHCFLLRSNAQSVSINSTYKGAKVLFKFCNIRIRITSRTSFWSVNGQNMCACAGGSDTKNSTLYIQHRTYLWRHTRLSTCEREIREKPGGT